MVLVAIPGILVMEKPMQRLGCLARVPVDPETDCIVMSLQ